MGTQHLRILKINKLFRFVGTQDLWVLKFVGIQICVSSKFVDTQKYCGIQNLWVLKNFGYSFVVAIPKL